MLHLNDNEFDRVFNALTGIVVMKFGAAWCAPCKVLTSIFDELEKDFSGKIHFLSVDIEEATKTTAQMAITSVPTVVIFKDGKKLKSFIGIKKKEFWIEEFSKI